VGRLNKTTKILLALLIVSLFIFSGIHVLQEKEIYELSREMEKEGEKYYQKKEYKKAKLFFERALKRYEELIVFKILKKDEIEKLRKRLKTDPILQKVAKGYIYYNGKWVNEKELEKLLKEKRRLKQKIDVYLKTAKFFGSIEDIENNITIYQDALKEIQKSPFSNDPDFKDLKAKLVSKIIFLSEEAAKKYKKQGNMKKTAYHLETVLKYKDDPQLKQELFNTYIQLYNDFITTGDYLKALSVLLKAKKLGINEKDLLSKIEYVLSRIDVEEIQKEKIEDPYVYYILAKKAYKRLDITDALSFTEKAVKLKPDFVLAKILHSRILLDLGELSEAEKTIKELLKKHPDNTEILILAGDLYAKEGELEKAVYYYEKAEKKADIKDKLFKVYKKIGLLYYERGQPEKAEKYLLKAIDLKDDPEVYRALGDIAYSKKELKKAEKYYLNALKINPSYKKNLSQKLGNIYLSIADRYKKEKKYRQAVTFYKKASAYLGNNKKIIKSIAESYEKLGDLKTALNYYKKLKTADLKNKEAKLYLSMAEKEYKKGNYFTALKYYKKAVERDKTLYEKVKDKIASCYEKIGDRYFSQKKYENALRYYKNAVNTNKDLENKLKEKLFSIYLSLGKKAYTEGKYKTAFRYLEKAEKINKENKELLFYLGELYLKEENYKKALNYFEKYAKTVKENPEVLKKLAYINAKLGNMKKAYRYASKLIDYKKHTGFAHFIIGAYYYYYEKNLDKALTHFLKAENSGYKKGELYYYMGKIYYDRGKFLRAITYLTKAINSGYRNEKVYYLRALAYLKLKDYRKAINDLSKVVKYNPDNAKAYYLRGMLYYKHGNYVKGEYRKAIEDLEKAAAMGIKEAADLLNEARTKR
jgi:tetratricopeptide (TPR) repeat protein